MAFHHCTFFTKQKLQIQIQSVLKNTSAALVNKALGALTRLVNTMAAGKVPERVRPFLCGARLVAGKKKDNSLRPIAIGNLLRRVE